RLHGQKESAGSAREIKMIERDAGKFGEGDGQQSEIDALDPEAKAEPADRRTEGGRYRHCGEDAEPGADAELQPEQRARVAAKPDIERMPKRKLAAESEHQIPRLPDIGEVEDQDQHGHDVAVDNQRRHRKQRQHQREQDPRSPVECAPELAHARRPMMPRGRSTSTVTSSAKENMLFIDGTSRNPASASDNPMSTPPTSAPVIEPSTPTMTMMKASSV